MQPGDTSLRSDELVVPRLHKSASFSHYPNVFDAVEPEQKGKYDSFCNGSFIFSDDDKTSVVEAIETETEGPSEPVFKENMKEEDNQIPSSDFRVSYMRALSKAQVLVPPAKRAPKQQTLIIFDWDDTLLCTTYLNQRDGQQMQSTLRQHLRGIADAVKRLLEMSLQLGHVFIITNAMEGWVEHSATKWVPELLPVLKKVQIISARARYEVLYPKEINQWKVNAFKDLHRSLGDAQVITNIAALGDASYEMDAAVCLGKEFSKSVLKTVKFKENPSPEELLKQLELVAQRFDKIVVNARSMKIGLERR